MAGTIICYGDSNTYGYDPCTLMGDQYPEQNRWTGILESETEWKIENHGICGRCIPHTGSQIRFACEQLKDWQDKDAPVWMWIMLGTNDLLQEQQFTAKDTAQRMETFLKKLMAEPAVSSGKITLYLIAPARMEYGAWVDEERLYQESRQLGEEYKKVAERLGIGFTDAGKWDIPVVYDGVHFSEKGHHIFAQNIQEEITMAFTAADVKKLREMTNVGMMDCKKALQATDGDMDAAVDWLREKGLAKAAKKADRVAAEGVAYAAVVNGIGVVIEVNSETDFAAKTDAFMDLVKNLATVVATENPADVDALKACKYPGSNLTVTEIMQEKVMSIGENMQIRRFARFADNTSVAYVHAGGTHGVLVNLAVEGGIDATEIGKNVAMQIAAMSPKYWDKSQVPQADVDKELAVQVALMDNDPKMASKPAAVKEKIAAGKMAAFYKESCLLQQEFVRSDLYKGDVAGYIADAAKKLGGKVTFVDAVHYVKGEGIEKKADDFAAEVAAQIAGAQK